MPYNYDRTASEDDTSKALAWLVKNRRKVIQKHLDEMGKSLDGLMDDALKQFPEMDRPRIEQELRRKEKDLRERLQG